MQMFSFRTNSLSMCLIVLFIESPNNLFVVNQLSPCWSYIVRQFAGRRRVFQEALGGVVPLCLQLRACSTEYRATPSLPLTSPLLAQDSVN